MAIDAQRIENNGLVKGGQEHHGAGRWRRSMVQGAGGVT
jgi:hypothetical protein